MSNNEQCHLCPIHTKAETRLNAVWLKRFKFVFFLKVVYYTFIGIIKDVKFRRNSVKKTVFFFSYLFLIIFY